MMQFIYVSVWSCCVYVQRHNEPDALHFALRAEMGTDFVIFFVDFVIYHSIQNENFVRKIKKHRVPESSLIV